MFIIGIAGGSGSGKSTFVKMLNQNLSQPVPILSQDNYYFDQSKVPMDERMKINFDHPDTIEKDLLLEHLKTLKAGASIQSPIYNHPDSTRKEATIQVDPAPVLIVEGLMVLVWEEIRAQLDLKLFVEVTEDKRAVRCLQRDIEERGRDFDQFKLRYFESVKPSYNQFIKPTKAYADLLIPKGGLNQGAIQAIADIIRLHQ